MKRSVCNAKCMNFEAETGVYIINTVFLVFQMK